MYSLGVKLMILVPCSTVSGMNKYTRNQKQQPNTERLISSVKARGHI